MSDESPSVYLDHWALRQIADSPPLRERLSSAIVKAAGTFCVSAWNILEFASMSDVETMRRAERLLAACMPRLFFIECDPHVVIQREDGLSTGLVLGPPHGDLELLEVVLSLKPKGLEVIGVQGIFDAVRGSGLEEKERKLGELFKSRVDDLRLKIAADQELQQDAGRVSSGPRLQRATRSLLREIVRVLSLQPDMRLSPNDAMDFLHAVVPIAYSDFVLLDRRWASLGRQAVQRLQGAGHRAHMSDIFSSKRGQVEDFLASVEVYSESPN